jgi:glucose-1-phosphate adenylyltransferase
LSSARAYREANAGLTKTTAALNLYEQAWPLWTHREQLACAKFAFEEDARSGTAIGSLVASDCIMSGATARRTLLFSSVRIDKHALVEDCEALPDVSVGKAAVRKKAIVDKHCRIPNGLTIGVDAGEDRRRFCVSERGVTLVVPELLGQRVHQLRRAPARRRELPLH